MSTEGAEEEREARAGCDGQTVRSLRRPEVFGWGLQVSFCAVETGEGDAPPSKAFGLLVLRSCRNIALPVSPTPNGDISSKAVHGCTIRNTGRNLQAEGQNEECAGNNEEPFQMMRQENPEDVG